MKAKLAGFSLLILFLTTSAFAQVEPLNDSDITQAVETELLVNKQIHSQLLNVETQNGIVTLSGTAKTLMEKDMAIRVAETVKGVRSVIDQITVEPEERTDVAIKTDVETALLVDPAVEKYQINVVVTKGIVTLTGTVESWAERQLCADVTKTVRGVRDINNDIKVETTSARPDNEIKRDIQGLLQNDVRINEDMIDVTVENGNVTLSGTVGSAYQKRQVTFKAWVPGATSVNNDDLKVQWWARDELRKSNPAEITDEHIKQAVMDAFLWDPRIYKFNPELSVKNGVVTLEGVVQDLRAKRAAKEDAENTAGVWHVVNLLAVKPQMQVKDMEIQQRVQESFDRNPLLNDQSVQVYVYDGHVYLSGHVPYYYQKKRAEEEAAKVVGVRDVTNELTTEDAWAYKEDWELADDVQRELFWNPLINEKDINVRVDDGVVFLTGEVQNVTEYREAETEAEEAGALSVANYLEIAHTPESFSTENLR